MAKLKVALLANLKVNAPVSRACPRSSEMTWIPKRRSTLSWRQSAPADTPVNSLRATAHF